jgi:hypothetical protein
VRRSGPLYAMCHSRNLPSTHGLSPSVRYLTFFPLCGRCGLDSVNSVISFRCSPRRKALAVTVFPSCFQNVNYWCEFNELVRAPHPSVRAASLEDG